MYIDGINYFRESISYVVEYMQQVDAVTLQKNLRTKKY